MISVACLQHVDFEGPAAIEIWANERGATFQIYRSDKGELPTLESYDMLVVLGGPMSVHDTGRYPWLEAEKSHIIVAISAGKSVVGVCLGAQLIAEALGGDVITSPEKEIGVYPLEMCAPEGHNNALATAIPPTFQALHWHGEMFTIPEDALHFATSVGCPNQGFVYDDRVVALQYHLEATQESVRALIENASADFTDAGRFIQDPEEMVEKVVAGTKKIRGQLYVILDTLLGRILTKTM